MKYLVKKKYRFDAEIEVEAATEKEARREASENTQVSASIKTRGRDIIRSEITKNPRKEETTQVRKIASGIADIPPASRERAYQDWLKTHDAALTRDEAARAARRAARKALSMLGTPPSDESGRILHATLVSNGAEEAVNAWRNCGKNLLDDEPSPTDISPFVELLDEALRKSADDDTTTAAQYARKLIGTEESQAQKEADDAASRENFARKCEDNGVTFAKNGETLSWNDRQQAEPSENLT